MIHVFEVSRWLKRASGTCSCCSNARSCASAPSTWTTKPSGETPQKRIWFVVLLDNIGQWHPQIILVSVQNHLQRYCWKVSWMINYSDINQHQLLGGYHDLKKQPCYVEIFTLWQCALNPSTFHAWGRSASTVAVASSTSSVRKHPRFCRKPKLESCDGLRSYANCSIVSRTYKQKSATSMHLFTCTTKFS